MSKQTPVYVSELKVQIAFIDEELERLEDKAYSGAFSAACKEKDRTEYYALKARRRELVKRIILHEPTKP